MTATNQLETENITLDTVRGNLMTDLQHPEDSTAMPSSTTPAALDDLTRHDLRTILERPVKLGTFTWSSTDEPLPISLSYADYMSDKVNYLNKFDFPQVIFQNSALIREKLQNFQYFKADVEIELKVNAQPFVAGMPALVHNPYYDQVQDFRRKGTRFLASQTSCPHKVLSLEKGNSMKMTIPYCNIYDYFDLGNSENQFGTVFVYVLSPLRGSATTSVQYTVFARFVNPQFYVPTVNEIMPEFATQETIKKLKKKGVQFAQSDTGEVVKPGPVATMMDTVATVAHGLSSLPVIGSISSSVAWPARMAANIATTMGWSKPTKVCNQETRVIKPGQTLIHTEGADDGTTLACFQDNGINPSASIPEKVDEMAFDYILQRPNMFHRFTVNSAAFSANKLLSKWEVSPFSSYQYPDTTDTKTLYLGSFALTAMTGTMWRGTINFDITTIKTRFHQGRYAVVFFPETTMDKVPDTLGEELTILNNVIVDLQDETISPTMRFPVKFASNVPHREPVKFKEDGTPDATTLETSIGTVAMYSLNQLSNPETVASEISFIISHSGGDDFLVDRPLMNLAPGYDKQYAQSDTGPVVIPSTSINIQPGGTTHDPRTQTSGEVFKSYRAFIKRAGRLTALRDEPLFTGLKLNHYRESDTKGNRIIKSGTIEVPALPTPVYMASFLYRFYAGSTSLKVVPRAPWKTVESYLSVDENMDTQIYGFKDQSGGQPVFEQQQNVSNIYEVKAPWYRAIRSEVVSTTQKPLLGGVRLNIRSNNNTGIGNNGSDSVYEAAGDDFHYFFLVGPPPMVSIKLIPGIASIPAGITTTTMDLSKLATFFGTEPTTPRFYPVSFDPDLAVPSTATRGYYTDDTRTFTVTYADGTTAKQAIANCALYLTATDSGITFYNNSSKSLNLSTTLAAIKALGTVIVRADVPEKTT